MPSDELLAMVDEVGRYFAREQHVPLVAGRVLGYLTVCEPAAQTIAELADALLASRSAITQAVVLLEGRGVVQRTRARGERSDRVSACLTAKPYEQAFDPTAFVDTAKMLRRAAAFLAHDPDRRATLDEFAELHEFLAEKFPQLRDEWLARRTDP